VQSAQSDRKIRNKRDFKVYPERDAPNSVGSTHRLEGQRPHKFPKVNLRQPNNFFGDEIRDMKLAKSNSEKSIPVTGIEKYQKRRLQELNQINKNNLEKINAHKILNYNAEYNLENESDLPFVNKLSSQKKFKIIENQNIPNSSRGITFDENKRLLNQKNPLNFSPRSDINPSDFHSTIKLSESNS
jgi:hypothetical protein